MQQNPNLFAGLGPFAGLAQAGSQLATRGIQGLFGIKDPELERNRILSQVNYDDPASLRAAAQALMAQGDVEAGMQLANQARSLTQRAEDVAFKQEELDLRKSAETRAKEAARWESFTKNPQLAIEEAAKEEDPAKKRELLMFAADKLTDKEYERAVNRARISASDATAAQARANAAKGTESDFVTQDDRPLIIRNGKYYTADGKEYTGKVKKLFNPSGTAGALSALGYRTGGFGGTTLQSGVPVYDPRTRSLVKNP
jgi:hypothetical protein